MSCNEAAVFNNNDRKLFMYRNTEGDWVVGERTGKSQQKSEKLFSIRDRSWEQL